MNFTSGGPALKIKVNNLEVHKQNFQKNKQKI